MASKNTTQVLIGGKIYTMSGYESEEYLQRVAAYLNNKITQIKAAEGYTRMSQEMRALLLNLNTADDYFKLKEKSDQLSENLSAKDKELYEIKHELISAQMKLESLTRDLESEQEEHRQSQQELTELRTRLEDLQAGLSSAGNSAPVTRPAQAAQTKEESPEEEAVLAPPAEMFPAPESEADPSGEMPGTETVMDAGEKQEGTRKQKYNRYYRR